MQDKIPIELSKYFKNGKDQFNEKYKDTINEYFRKYLNYSLKDRLFYNVEIKDQYANKHYLPYFLSTITLPEKKFTFKDIEINPYFFDCNLTSLDEIAHFVRCFPFSSSSEINNDVWTSPDLMIKLRKGSIEEHSLLMASLMLGLKRKNTNKKNY